jgi:hypothetical protein
MSDQLFKLPTKVCLDPCCQEVALNCPVKTTRCKNCGSRLIIINQKTYEEKYKNDFFQYNYLTGERVTTSMEKFESYQTSKSKSNLSAKK